MAKTAEEILKEHTFLLFQKPHGISSENTISAMREFAAQEVEEYRLKIRSKVFEMYTSTGDLDGLEIVGHEAAVAAIIKLIDTVK